jgi:hypothetical protein
MKTSSCRKAAWSLLSLSLGVMSGVSCSGDIGAANGTGAGAGGTGPMTGTGTGGSGPGTTTGTGTGGSGTDGGDDGPGGGGSGGNDGGVTPPPFEAMTARTIVRKVKNLLVGQAPLDSDVTAVTNDRTAGLQGLIASWMMTPEFRERMVFFFRSTFQQTGFSPLDGFKLQLMQSSGFDLGPVGIIGLGDDAFVRLVQNLQDSFALTAWQIVAERRPFAEVLTTRKFMMTTGLKSLYLQIEMPHDQPLRFGVTKLPWKVDMSGAPIPLEDTLNPASPNYMIFSDERPGVGGIGVLTPTCQGTPGKIMPFEGYGLLFQRLFGLTPRSSYLTQKPECWEHASKPYFTTQDLSDWQWVNIRPLKSGERYVQPYDSTLRKATEIAVALPRVGFYTTPAYLALWSTNDSNQHRVTANQTLLVALGQSFTSANSITPASTTGLDSSHAVNGTECHGCHKSLDPLREFWGTQFDYNDRNDFLPVGFSNVPANPRPTTIGGALAFGNVNASGGDMFALGPMLEQVTDPDGLTRFAISMTQYLCFYANSSACLESDPEFRRIALGFQNSKFDFMNLVSELFSSPLVTAATPTATTTQMASPSASRGAINCAEVSPRASPSRISAHSTCRFPRRRRPARPELLPALPPMRSAAAKNIR